MMRSIHRLWLPLVGSFIILASFGFLQAETSMTDHHHSHGQNDHAVSGLSLDHGEKWKTDTALRQGMQSINDAVMNAVSAYHHETLTKTEAEKLARHINDQVGYLVTNCRLEAGADAALHVLIGDLLTASATLSNEPLSSQGLPLLVKTLKLYPDYFDHQDWGISGVR